MCPFGAIAAAVSDYSFLKLTRSPVRCVGRADCGICERVCPKQVRVLDEPYEFFTGKASEINRSLALGGIAIIWIFKSTSSEVSLLPPALILPLILLVVGLGLDLFQYIVAGAIWFFYYKFMVC